MFVAVIVGVVFITLGQRRIPMQSAKHVRGRRVMGGTRQYLPLKVNQAGVMPIIFASSLLMLPALLFGGMARLVRRQRLLGPDVRRADASMFSSTGFVLRRLLHRADLLLLLLLDGDHVQSQGHVRQPEELRLVHSRLSPGQADGRLPGKGDGPHHLRRRRRSWRWWRSCRR